MAFKLPILLLILINLIPLITSRYKYTACQLERKYCGEYKHIGCDDNHFHHSKNWTNFHMETMTPALKVEILREYNTIKNNLALGLLHNKETGGNLEVIQWNSEFQHLAELEVKHVGMEEETCNLINEFNDCYQMYHKVVERTITTKHLIAELFDILNQQSNGKDNVWLSEHIGGVTHIGCAISKYHNHKGHHVHLISCGINGGLSYRVGEPCEYCEDIDKHCDTIYNGLCI